MHGGQPCSVKRGLPKLASWVRSDKQSKHIPTRYWEARKRFPSDVDRRAPRPLFGSDGEILMGSVTGTMLAAHIQGSAASRRTSVHMGQTAAAARRATVMQPVARATVKRWLGPARVDAQQRHAQQSEQGTRLLRRWRNRFLTCWTVNENQPLLGRRHQDSRRLGAAGWYACLAVRGQQRLEEGCGRSGAGEKGLHHRGLASAPGAAQYSCLSFLVWEGWGYSSLPDYTASAGFVDSNTCCGRTT